MVAGELCLGSQESKNGPAESIQTPSTIYCFQHQSARSGPQAEHEGKSPSSLYFPQQLTFRASEYGGSVKPSQLTAVDTHFPPMSRGMIF